MSASSLVREMHIVPLYRQPPNVWLDLLPLDVCTRISSMLPVWQLFKEEEYSYEEFAHPAVIFLAQTSPYQKRAVIADKSQVLRIVRDYDYFHAFRLFRSWHQILGDEISEVHLLTHFDYEVPLPKCRDYIPLDAIQQVLSLSTISKATVNNSPSLFRALIAGPEVSENESATFLRSLEVVCEAKKLERLGEAASIFSSLERLSLEHVLNFYDRQDMLPGEQEGSFRLTISSSLKERLQSVSSVGIINCAEVDEVVPFLGKRLTKISSKEPAFQYGVQMLRECPNMESLDLVLSRGTEIYFPANMCSLRSITLTWQAKEGDSARKRNYLPHPGFLVALVRRNNQLREIRLRNVKIPPADLDGMLKCVGDQLESFQIPIQGKANTLLELIKRVALLLGEHNRNVSDLVFGPGDLKDAFTYETGCMHENVCSLEPYVCRECPRWKRIDVSWQILDRRLPRLSAASICRLRWQLAELDKARESAIKKRRTRR